MRNGCKACVVVDRRFIAWLLFTASLFLLWTTLRPQFVPDEVKPINDPVAQSKNSSKNGERRSHAIGSRHRCERGSDRDFCGLRFPSLLLGSFQPEAGFRLGVTVSSRGAGIERIELVEQTKPGRFRYRSLEGETGYLGYLSLLLPVKDGLLVRSVPAGSPAALAKCDDPAVAADSKWETP